MANKGIDILAKTADQEFKGFPKWARRTIFLLILLAAIILGILYLWPDGLKGMSPQTSFYSISGAKPKYIAIRSKRLKHHDLHQR